MPKAGNLKLKLLSKLTVQMSLLSFALPELLFFTGMLAVPVSILILPDAGAILLKLDVAFRC